MFESNSSSLEEGEVIGRRDEIKSKSVSAVGVVF